MADGSKEDRELLNIIEFLEEIKNENDVRDVLTEKFGIRKALEESKMLWTNLHNNEINKFSWTIYCNLIIITFFI